MESTLAYELAIYEDTKRIIAHTLTCPTISSVTRTYQSGPMIRVTPGWMVIRCDKCLPLVYVVHVTQKAVRVNQNASGIAGYQFTRPIENPRGPDGPNNYSVKHTMAEWNRVVHRKEPESSFPPYGVTALDITHSENREEWWKQAECNSDDERLGPWLLDLYMSDRTAHWALTIQKVVCSQCPVRAECLEQGVWGNEKWGVWGGANERERRQLRMKWNKEGRVDERPNRPRNPIYGERTVLREDGSWVATESGSDDNRDDPRARESTETGEVVYQVRTQSSREVRWPRNYDFTGSGWSSEGSGRG